MSEPDPVEALLIPNVAAEEGAVWSGDGGEAQIRAVARLWRLLFGPTARVLGEEASFEAVWPTALGALPHGSVFPELDVGNAFAWLHTRQAAEIAKDLDYELASPTPKAVQIVHDKAFAVRGAQALGEEPEALRTLIEIIEPEILRGDPGAVLERVERSVGAWPNWTGGRFTLKPRIGSSGRGRVGGQRKQRGGAEGLAALAGAFPRLAERGGAVLEPWLERVRDLSAQLWIEPDGAVRLLGTLELLVSPAGVYRGHRGSIDNKGRVTSLCPEDEALREAAAQLASAAAAQGFVGPCGIDAFTFRGPAGEHLFRPVVEFNGRFTLGTIVVGLLRRALRTLRRELPRDASERRAFHFSLAPPASGWPADPPPGCLMLPLSGSDEAAVPGLLVANDVGQLEIAFQGQEIPSMLRH